MLKKKIVALLLTAALMSGVSACSSNSSETSASVSLETTTAASTTEETTTEESTEETTEEVMEESPDFLQGYDTFEVSSHDLVDGVWADVISNTEAGENLSPELHWDEVDGASLYVLYMVDTTAGNWIHMKVEAVTSTSLSQGELSTIEYIGPYPPEGTHTYDVYVVALANPVEHAKGTLNNQSPNFEQFINELDVDADGNSGNIVAYGRLSGTYSHA